MTKELSPETLAACRDELAVLDKKIDRGQSNLAHLTERRDAVARLLHSCGYPVAAFRMPRVEEIRSLEMTRTVIMNAGRPLSVASIIMYIHKTYGCAPAPTLGSLLAARVDEKRGFFQTDTGEFGVDVMQAVLTTVFNSASA